MNCTSFKCRNRSTRPQTKPYRPQSTRTQTNSAPNNLGLTPTRTQFSSVPRISTTMNRDEGQYYTPQHVLANVSYAVRVHRINISIRMNKSNNNIPSLFNQGLMYFKSSESYLHWCLFIPSFLFVWPPYLAPCDIQWIWSTLAVAMSWVNIIFVLNRYDASKCKTVFIPTTCYTIPVT